MQARDSEGRKPARRRDAPEQVCAGSALLRDTGGRHGIPKSVGFSERPLSVAAATSGKRVRSAGERECECDPIDVIARLILSISFPLLSSSLSLPLFLSHTQQSFAGDRGFLVHFPSLKHERLDSSLFSVRFQSPLRATTLALLRRAHRPRGLLLLRRLARLSLLLLLLTPEALELTLALSLPSSLALFALASCTHTHGLARRPSFSRSRRQSHSHARTAAAASSPHTHSSSGSS